MPPSRTTIVNNAALNHFGIKMCVCDAPAIRATEYRHARARSYVGRRYIKLKQALIRVMLASTDAGPS